MNILVTGSKGFIGRNLLAELTNKKYDGLYEIFEYDLDCNFELLDEFTRKCDFVIHLAGINRPKNVSEFDTGNYGFTTELIESLTKNNNKCPILISSSIQAELDNPYGVSKKKSEEYLFNYGESVGAKVLVYRLPNVFGKWCRPNYNSAIATFCYNIANNLDIIINDRNHMMNLVYIDDVVKEFINAINGNENRKGKFCYIEKIYHNTLGEIADLLYSFKENRKKLIIPDMNDDFVKALYSTYLSYLPANDFGYDLKMNVDSRGSFTEMIRTNGQGQLSINISKPGIVKGNHWHHTKNEKFLVVYGTGVIRFRNVQDNKIIEYFVSGEKLQVVDIPCGYTHNIENLGDTDMVTVMWCNECFDPDNPDTIYLEV